MVMSSETLAQNGFVTVSRHYDGQYHRSKGNRYLSPTLEVASNAAAIPSSETFYYHRDFLGRITHRPRDLARYISPTYGKPFRICVQATTEAFQYPQGEWRRVRLRGRGNRLLRLCVWAVGDGGELPTEPKFFAFMILRVLLIAPAQLILLPFDFQGGPVIKDMYPSFPSRSWDYPKYARNPLDASPIPKPKVKWGKGGEEAADYHVVGEQERLLKPRQLVILKDKVWTLSEGTDQPYIVISYANHHFKNNEAKLESLAEKLASEAGVKAYWADFKCRAKEQPGLTDDVHRICDVFRGARQVCVVLPDLETETKQFWGSRMWCLPEALLSSQQKLKFCSSEGKEEWTKLELAAHVWTDRDATRLLAEHYTGLLTLSRLELISIALEALTSRFIQTEQWTPGDIAYALMSLLHYRPRMNPEDSLFQALGRLSLANDSDRIMERMVCMLPDITKAYHSAFVVEDILGAKLWDIEPLCQVAGVGNDNEIFLDGCKGASIRWKDIPRIHFYGRRTAKRRLANLVRSAPLWWVLGVVLLATGVPSRDTGITTAGAIFFVIGQGLIFASSWLLQIVYSGKVWGSTPWLVGFEGTLPLREVERKAFGNAIGRLRYAPSSGVLCEREPNERIGKGPAWIENPDTPNPKPDLPEGHRLFTLIDTGPSMMVHVFSAARPPTVALLCGKEGGMLRVVLCSYQRETNCLRKETVLRMETPMLSLTKLHSWLKLV